MNEDLDNVVTRVRRSCSNKESVIASQESKKCTRLRMNEKERKGWKERLTLALLTYINQKITSSSNILSEAKRS